jgi:hypothetical protein
VRTGHNSRLERQTERLGLGPVETGDVRGIALEQELGDPRGWHRERSCLRGQRKQVVALRDDR